MYIAKKKNNNNNNKNNKITKISVCELNHQIIY